MLKRGASVFSSVFAKYKEFILVSSVLFIFLFVFFNKALLFGQIPSPSDLLTFWPLFSSNQSTQIQNWLMSDVIVQHEPWQHYNRVSIQDFTIPLWNPYSGCGVPHIANMQSAFFYPLNWFIYILGFKIGLLACYFTKLYLIGIFTYYYLRSIKLEFLASLIGSTAFMFCGYNIVWLYWPLSNPIFVLPLLLFLIEKIIQNNEKKKVYFVAYSIAIAFGVFGGHPETFFHIAVVSFLYFVFRLSIERRVLISDKFKILRNYLLFCLLGIALSAVQLLPFLEYLFNSFAWVARSNIQYMLNWHTAILNLVPTFYGSPSIYHKVPYYISYTNYNESTAGYVGISFFIFAVFALITNYKDNFVRFYLLLSIWAVGVIYGIFPIFDFTVSLPGFSHAANHRLLFLLGFNVVVLGTIGLNKILGDAEKNKDCMLNRFLISTLVVLTVLYSLSYFNRGFLYSLSNLSEGINSAQNILVLITCAIILMTFLFIYILLKYAHCHWLKVASIIGIFLLVFAQTGIYGMLFEPAVGEKSFYPRINAFDVINEYNGLYRTTSIGSLSCVYPANTQMIYGIYDIRDYDALNPRYYRELLNVFAEGRLHGWGDLFDVDNRFLDFMGVKWILSRHDLSKGEGIAIKGNTNPVGELTKDFLVEQEFTSLQTNLSKIVVLFATYGKEGVDSNITIELIDKDTSKVVEGIKFNSRVIRDNQMYPFEFAPHGNSRNKRYILRISGDGCPGQSITLWMNKNTKDATPGGKLYLNRMPTRGSLCFNVYHDKTTNFILFKKYLRYNIFENNEAQPRAFVVQNAVFKSNDTKILNVLNNKSFNWKSSVVISGHDHAVHYPPSENNVRIVNYNSTSIKIMVNTTQPGFLVLSDTYYPGWNAYINGDRCNILRANYAFRALELPKGEKMVEFKYEPLSFYVGGLISSIALLVLSIIFFIKKGSRIER